MRWLFQFLLFSNNFLEHLFAMFLQWCKYDGTSNWLHAKSGERSRFSWDLDKIQIKFNRHLYHYHHLHHYCQLYRYHQIHHPCHVVATILTIPAQFWQYPCKIIPGQFWCSVQKVDSFFVQSFQFFHWMWTSDNKRPKTSGDLMLMLMLMLMLLMSMLMIITRWQAAEHCWTSLTETSSRALLRKYFTWVILRIMLLIIYPKQTLELKIEAIL